VHRYLGLLTGAFIGLHALGLLLDTYLPFSVTQLVVPGASSYRPLAVALGVVAAELLAAVAVTNALRKRIPHVLWRRVHCATFAVWAFALVHGLTAGTDARAPWALALYTVAAASVAGLTVWRAGDVSRARGGQRPRRGDRPPARHLPARPPRSSGARP
jgi:sulfoxide reductase heme-binding subunit YedZ